MLKRLTLVIVAFACLPNGLRAQTTNGIITGVITDSSGAVVPEAQVSVVKRDTGQERTAVSDASGLYVVPQLAPGVYTLTAVEARLRVSQAEQHSTPGQSKFDDRRPVLGRFDHSDDRSYYGAAHVEYNVVDAEPRHRA